MRSFFKLAIVVILISVLFAHAQAQQWGGIVDSSRAVNWSNAGNTLIDGVRTKCGSTIAAYTGTAATINNAIASCAATAANPKYVELGSGTFNLSSGINLHQSYVTLRGQGANATFLVFSGAGAGNYNSVISLEGDFVEVNGSERNICTWSSGYAKGTTTITLSTCSTGAVTNLKVGGLLILDQLDETADTGKIWNCLNSTVEGGPQCSNNGTGAGGFQRTTGATIPCATCTGGVMKYRSQQQVVRVTSCATSLGGAGDTTVGRSCTNGTNIGITPGLYMPNWNSAQKPEAWFPGNTLVGAGIEDFSIQTGTPNGIGGTNTAGSSRSVHIGRCDKCWVKGIRSLYANRSHVMLLIAKDFVVRDSYFYQNIDHFSVSYGVEMNSAFDGLVENNIFQQSTDGEPNCNGSCAGNVVAYNFDIDNVWGSAGWMQAGFYAHSSGDYLNLWEGNIGPGYTSDDVHGTHHFTTLFRNRLFGNQSAGCGSTGPSTCTAQTIPINAYAGSRYFNVIGNVLGWSGYHNVYTSNCISDDSCWNGVTSIYRTGQTGPGGTLNNGFCTSPSCTSRSNYDPQVGLYMMKWGNWDVVSSSNDNGSNDATGTKFNASEVPSGLAAYSNAVPATTALPASFYRSSKPSWFGSIAWPPIGPDVSGGNILNSGGHANKIPAQVCFESIGGPVDGSGTFLNFNAASCYGSTSGGITPTAPGGLSAVVK